ncbi:MAG: hypothetical protein HQ503_12845, partial [Rhodospirillales bacterium]|nr:hypothetical protein [Rhodospirillales bacterium]
MVERITASAWIYLAVSLIAIAEAFYPLSWAAPVSSALIVIFIILQFQAIPRP